MSRRPDPDCRDAIKWLRANKHSLGALTGQDASALEAIAHCWRLYARSDHDGRKAALEAVRALLLGMQPQCRPFARELIAWAMDWDDRGKLWPLVAPEENGKRLPLGDARDVGCPECGVGAGAKCEGPAHGVRLALWRRIREHEGRTLCSVPSEDRP